MKYVNHQIKKVEESCAPLSEKAFACKEKAIRKNPNLYAVQWYLDEDFAGFKKGYLYKIVDSKTDRQTSQNWQTIEEAWEHVAIIECDYPSYLAKP